MSSNKDERIQDMYDKMIKGGNKNDTSHGNLLEILSWFKSLNLLEIMKISEHDVEKAFKSVSGNMTTIDSVQFLIFLSQLSITAQIEMKIQEKLLELLLENEFLEKQFKEKLAEGKACLEDIKDWMTRNNILNKADLMKPEVAEVLNKLKDQASINLNEFSQAMERLSEQIKFNCSDLLKRVFDPVPRASTSEKQEKKSN